MRTIGKLNFRTTVKQSRIDTPCEVVCLCICQACLFISRLKHRAQILHEIQVGISVILAETSAGSLSWGGFQINSFDMFTHTHTHTGISLRQCCWDGRCTFDQIYSCVGSCKRFAYVCRMLRVISVRSVSKLGWIRIAYMPTRWCVRPCITACHVHVFTCTLALVMVTTLVQTVGDFCASVTFLTIHLLSMSTLKLK